MQRYTRDLLLYGEGVPLVTVLRVPVKGVSWRTLMQATNRLVRALEGTPRGKKPGVWSVEADTVPPLWEREATKGKRWEWDGKDFVRRG